MELPDAMHLLETHCTCWTKQHNAFAGLWSFIPHRASLEAAFGLNIQTPPLPLPLVTCRKDEYLAAHATRLFSRSSGGALRAGVS